MRLTLPQPDPFALQHSQKLLQRIIATIEAQGPISFAEYMRMALYEPGLGYYSAGAYKFGAEGDFVTAPEISPLFSRCVARQCLQVLNDIADGVIFELGAGSGRMALDILLEIERQGAVIPDYFILEVSADLKERQQQLFRTEGRRFFDKIHWLTEWPRAQISGVVIANEVIDAMPVHKFRWQGEWLEYYVTVVAGKLAWHLDQFSSAELAEALHQLQIDFSDGYDSEINLLLPSWIAGIADCLKQGLVLLIDYGFPRHEYYHPDRSQGTLMCHYRHRAHPDPLFLPGIQDMTAHVDFTAVAIAADAVGLDVRGFTHQAAFLINCGLATMLDTASDHYLQMSQQVKQLTLPNEMGELFKACALTKCYDPPLLGFQMMNQLERL